MADAADTAVSIPRGNASVVVEDVRVTYRTETSNVDELTGWRRWLGQLRLSMGLTAITKVEALKGVTFTVYEGEHIGIVGSNGSGKSTLLRVIAGVEPTASGRVRSLATPMLLGVNAALLPAMSGRRNVRLGLLALGFPPAEVTRRMQAVISLADIGEAIDRPMATYSSGQGARLRFAIAAAAQPEILLIDEALGTGDAAFAARSKRTIDELRQNAGTIFLVSHAAQTIEKMCSRAIWLHQGELITDGPAREVARAYRWWAHNVALENEELADELLMKARRRKWPAPKSRS